MTADVVIIGGGVSGLAVAHDLKRRGHRVTVLERQTQTGGNAVSERQAGFLMEHGPSTMNAHLPVSNEISRQLGLDSQRCDLGDGIQNRYLVSDGRLAGISTGALGFLTASYLSPLAKLRILAEFLVPHGSDQADETVMDFCSRRFGREFAERVMDPMVAGIYGGGRASELSVSAIFPMLVALEKKYGSVTLGIMHRRREGGKMPGSRLFSWRDGMATLTRTLAQGLKENIRTGIAVRRISPHHNGFRIDLGNQECLQAKAVVVATQAHVAARLISELDPQGVAAAEQIQAPPLAVVFLGFPRKAVAHPLDGLGFLTAEAENRGLLGSQFCSTMFPGRAPEGQVAVSAYIGGNRAPDLARLPAPELIELARREFRDLIGATGEPTVARVRHWPVGLPQYRAGHRGLIKVLGSTHNRQAGLFLTGNYFAGPSVAVCLSVAQKTALAAHGYLESGKSVPIQRTVS
ncbi:MAG: protoporphyrinogen oxidase [Proteobacteria bacterium]|nr:protoporphyrinogen oxidase [Pseudomonadota bacterium]